MDNVVPVAHTHITSTIISQENYINSIFNHFIYSHFTLIMFRVNALCILQLRQALETCCAASFRDD